MTISAIVYLVMMLVTTVPAMAQDPGSSIFWDPNTVLKWLLSIVSLVISGAIPIVVPFILRKLHLENNQTIVDALTDAASRAAGIGYNWMVEHAPHLGLEPIEVKNKAIAEGVKYIKDRYPQYTTIKALRGSEEAIAKIIDGELGKLLAVDPNTQITWAAPSGERRRSAVGGE